MGVRSSYLPPYLHVLSSYWTKCFPRTENVVETSDYFPKAYATLVLTKHLVERKVRVKANQGKVKLD